MRLWVSHYMVLKQMMSESSGAGLIINSSDAHLFITNGLIGAVLTRY